MISYEGGDARGLCFDLGFFLGGGGRARLLQSAHYTYNKRFLETLERDFVTRSKLLCF